MDNRISQSIWVQLSPTTDPLNSTVNCISFPTWLSLKGTCLLTHRWATILTYYKLRQLWDLWSLSFALLKTNTAFSLKQKCFCTESICVLITAWVIFDTQLVNTMMQPISVLISSERFRFCFLMRVFQNSHFQGRSHHCVFFCLASIKMLILALNARQCNKCAETPSSREANEMSHSA